MDQPIPTPPLADAPDDLDAPDFPGPGPKVRRSQADRRREMRDRLVEATLDSLAANGYPGASLGDILARAGVSRGAWAHHFASKKDLVALAAQVMLGRAADRARTLTIGTEAAEDRLPALLEAVWGEFYHGRHRDVLFEVGLACRTDAELRRHLAPVFGEFMEALGSAWRVHFRLNPAAGGQVTTLGAGGAGPGTGAGDDGVLTAVLAITAYMMRGMALQEMVTGEQRGHAELRRFWAGILAGLVDVVPLEPGPA
ncbi:MAG: hypothetical protein RLY86_1278 [Pseudomonadota bacterium]|jgi:AcrR family transcriptional regulator